MKIISKKEPLLNLIEERSCDSGTPFAKDPKHSIDPAAMSERNPIRSMEIIKDSKYDGVLYRIFIEIEEKEVEMVEVEACETGFRATRDSQTYQSYNLPGLLS